MDTLEIKLLLKAVDRATRPMRGVNEAANVLQRSIGETGQALKDIDQAAKRVQHLQALREKLGANANADALATARAKAAELRQALRDTGDGLSPQARGKRRCRRRRARG